MWPFSKLRQQEEKIREQFWEISRLEAEINVMVPREERMRLEVRKATALAQALADENRRLEKLARPQMPSSIISTFELVCTRNHECLVDGPCNGTPRTPLTDAHRPFAAASKLDPEHTARLAPRHEWTDLESPDNRPVSVDRPIVIDQITPGTAIIGGGGVEGTRGTRE